MYQARPASPLVTLSSSSVYPLGVAAVFETAARLGYDGVEIMVLSDPATQEAKALSQLSRTWDMPVLSIHAPTLLVSQRVWGTSDPWPKVDKSIELAGELGADTVVLHPPFRWQREYAVDFVDGVALREHDSGIALAVENMFPWRARNTHMQAYLPHWDPVSQAYDHVTLDLSHAATSGSDALEMQWALGRRLHHVHLGDGSGSMMDEHLVPGRGAQPCGAFLERLTETGFAGVVAVEVGTRRLSPEQRELDLAEALAYARLHLGQAVVPGV